MLDFFKKKVPDKARLFTISAIPLSGTEVNGTRTYYCFWVNGEKTFVYEADNAANAVGKFMTDPKMQFNADKQPIKWLVTGVSQTQIMS